MGLIFIALVVAFSIPALFLSYKMIRCLLAIEGQLWHLPPVRLLQIVFLIYVEKQTITLDYSSRFAALGVPCCILALVLKHKDITRQYKSGGIMLGAILWACHVVLFDHAALIMTI